DLSDFFYVWLRRSLRSVYPADFSTLLTPKAPELIASPYRHGSKEEAERHFEKGLAQTFVALRSSAALDYPFTVFYAFKQGESTSNGGIASTGWETMLTGLIESGL